VQAYVLIETEPGKLWRVAESALGIEGVKMAHAVTGEYDVVVYAEFTNMEALGTIIDRLHSLEGVLRTHTAVAMAPRLTDY